MLDRIFPKEIDNRFRGYRLALWLFVLIALMHIAISLGAIFASDGGAQSADGIPLYTFAPQARQAIIGIVAFLGLADLWLGLIFALALTRYRALIPLMYVLVVADYLGHKAIGLMKPIVRMAGTSHGSVLTLALFAVSVIGLVLSVSGEGYRSHRDNVTATQ